MPHQINIHVTNAPVKRRMIDEEDQSDYGFPAATFFADKVNQVKRLNDNADRVVCAPEEPAPRPLPALTFASPDYRPPPRPDALWLQPVPQTVPATPMALMEDDSTDDDDNALRTPSIHVPTASMLPHYHTHHHAHPESTDHVMHDA